MMNTKKKITAIVIGVFALIIATTAVSFAFFTYSRVGNTTTTITSGDIEFTYKEGEAASLANAFPVSDSVGANDTSEEYTFTVNLKSSSASNKMNYNVYLLDNNKGTDNYFTNDHIKFALTKDGTFVAGTSGTEGKKLTDISGFTTGQHTGEGIVIENQEIVSGKTDEYKLRIWISDEVDYSNTDSATGQDEQTSSGKYNGYKYSLKVKVTSEIGNSIIIGDLAVTNKTITANLTDPNGLDSYAVTTSQTAPASDSSEWITITNESVKNNIQRTANGLITSKAISYTVPSNGTYYLYVKNKLNQISKKEFKINVTTYEDESGANVPVLKTGMIPVTYSNGNWLKADTTSEWYNYNEQMWANAVTVSEANRQTYMDATAGTPISMNDINTMWVWVPRYEYETFTSTTATEIKVNFLSGTASNKTSNYITHPAFTFGTDSLEGIWVAKFEASSDTTCTPTTGDIDKGCDLTSLKVNVKPNVTSWRGIRVSTLDLNTRAMNDSGNIYGFLENEVDTHAMRNLEWGAVAYLSQSKYGKYGNADFTVANKEIYQNKSDTYITGMSNGTPSTSTTGTLVAYNVEGTGTGASSTGNIYGIYDMSGGAWDYVMGVMKDNSSNNPMSGNSTTYNSGFTGKLYDSGKYTSYSERAWPESKYFDLYDFGTTYNGDAAYRRAKTGDATTETKGWYGDYASFAFAVNPWFVRGGNHSNDTWVGVWAFGSSHGHANAGYAFRPVLVQK